eukprot:CAMPEP_0119348484 /NCGR_PEP_ID=MMETSP1333-20130426/109069_1 /TAXON_ID=418940 /ORGANISM="Scyphosphaera apsteinii, Strain RCC1455" /LENGTH=31 /DNA_ID= /DNA_START= /DNA_END= /DNA_ORIENTATION=
MIHRCLHVHEKLSTLGMNEDVRDRQTIVAAS